MNIVNQAFPRQGVPVLFAVTGVAGYVAPRHLKAIKETGNELVMGLDTANSGEMLSKYFPRALYFNSPEQFELYFEGLRDQPKEYKVDYVSVCSPTHLHDEHIRLALNSGAHVICEKPIVINPSDLRLLEEVENKNGRRVYTILQLRLHESLIALRRELCRNPISSRPVVVATHITSRSPGYYYSWKADEKKSGGIAMNIGIHLFDLLIWLFGKVERSETHLATREKMAGALEMERADVRWFLSIDPDDLPTTCRIANRSVFRSIVVDGKEFDCSERLDGLHTRAYERILEGKGLGIDDARPSIELVHLIRQSTISNGFRNRHPMLSFESNWEPVCLREP